MAFEDWPLKKWR